MKISGSIRRFGTALLLLGSITTFTGCASVAGGFTQGVFEGMAGMDDDDDDNYDTGYQSSEQSHGNMKATHK